MTTQVTEYESLLTALTTLEEYSLARMVDEADALDADDDRRNKLFGDVATVQAFLNSLNEFVEKKKNEPATIFNIVLNPISPGAVVNALTGDSRWALPRPEKKPEKHAVDIAAEEILRQLREAGAEDPDHTQKAAPNAVDLYWELPVGPWAAVTLNYHRNSLDHDGHWWGTLTLASEDVGEEELDLRADTQEIFIERAVSLLLGPLTYKSQEG